jgi:hypothetical protein
MTNTEQVIAANQWRKLISGEPYGEGKQVELTVRAELVKLGGNSYAHYSITGIVKKLDKRYRDPFITGGAIHEIILKHFPELAPIVKVHLSEPDGVPMHAEANARYWCGLTKYSPRDSYGRITIETDGDGIEWSPDTLASHLQTDRATACELREALKSGLPWDKVTAHLGLIELWSKQAGAARKLLNDREMA